MAVQSFADALRQEMTSRKKASKRAKVLLDLLKDKPSRRRTRILERLEKHARLHLEDLGLEVGDDWSEVSERDWGKFFDSLLKFLLAILSAVLPLFMGDGSIKRLDNRESDLDQSADEKTE